VKIIARDNFDSETYTERLVVDNIPTADIAWTIVAELQARARNGEGFVVVPDGYHINT
jgi:hypothetical protein